MLLTMARVIAAGLLVASAAAFAAGAAIERHAACGETRVEVHHAETGTLHDNSGRTEPASSSECTGARAAGAGSEKLLGINPEATGLIVTAVAVSLLLAALILTISSPWAAAVAAAAMLAFTALDIREVTHQLHESRAGLAALAAAVALLHLAAGAAAVLAARGARRRTGSISTA